MNSNRYTTSKYNYIAVKDEDIKSLLAIKPPFDIYTGKSYFTLAKENAILRGSRRGFEVFIYKNGVEIPGSPFKSYRKGGEAIGLKSVSSITNYIDTGKVFKEEFTFYSKKL
jgi:hypothetical protein